MLDYNNTPLEDCDGFTPLQMHEIIYFPFDKECVIKLNNANSEQLINESPILKIIIEFLIVIRYNKIKLTQNGNLPLRFINDIYNKKYLLDEDIENGFVKIRTETDWIPLHNVKLVLTLAGFIRKKYNYLLITKKCESLLKNGDYTEIFYEFLKTFALKFNWAYNDRYTNEAIGQIGFLYSLHTINKYGNNKTDLKYFSNLYFKAFPTFIELNIEGWKKEAAYHTRFIERFALWFGFVEEEIAEGKNYLERDIKIKRTNLLKHLLE
ncbi:MAG: hypothetical protein WC209_02480 [Ignavibacteriaceae bacterium]